MSMPTLVIGNRNYSSWSMRPWFGMKATGIDFEEVVIPLFEDGSSERIRKYSPTGKVPVLVHDGLTIWDSLAILEYAAETWPEAGLLPADRAARAVCRSLCAEMHSGFTGLRSTMSMNVRRRVDGFVPTPEAVAEVARLTGQWGDCRARFGADGPFLFGSFTMADAMYAPVATRLRTYGVSVDAASQAYMDALFALPAFTAWEHLADEETWTIPRYEV